MLGYDRTLHDNCDLWNPSPEEWGAVKERDVAFSVFAKHTQETEDLINEIVRRGRMGDTNFTLDLDDDFSDDELEYIKQEVQRRL